MGKQIMIVTYPKWISYLEIVISFISLLSIIFVYGIKDYQNANVLHTILIIILIAIFVKLALVAISNLIIYDRNEKKKNELRRPRKSKNK